MASSSLPRHDTYQSDDTFSVSVYVRNLESSDVAVSFRERSVRLLPLLEQQSAFSTHLTA